MYTNDKQQRITLRLNEEQFEFIRWSAEMMGVSPSEFLRIVINMTMAGRKQSGLPISEEGVGRANDKANINNQL